MNSKIILLITFILSNGDAFSQGDINTQHIYTNNPTTYKIYSQVLRERADGEKVVFTVSQKARARTLKSFDFKNPKSVLIDTTHEMLIDAKKWKKFLAAIDTALIKPYPLELAFSTDKNFKIRFPKKNEPIRRERKLKRGFEASPGRIFFSPVVFSRDFKQAVCVVESYSDPDASGGAIYFLEQNGGGWVIVEVIQLYIS